MVARTSISVTWKTDVFGLQVYVASVFDDGPRANVSSDRGPKATLVMNNNSITLLSCFLLAKLVTKGHFTTDSYHNILTLTVS